MSTLDADILATLTEEERDAIKDSDDEELQPTAMVDGADSSDDDADDEDEAADDAAGTAKAPVEGRAPASAAEPDQVKYTEPKAIYQAQAPADLADRINALDAAEDEAHAKFEGGEIDANELRRQRVELRQQREALTAQRVKAEISQEMQEQMARTEWDKTVNGFLDSVVSTVDYRQDADKAADLDEFVKKLASNPAHNDKDMGWFLREAHKRVSALHGLPMDAPAAKAKPARSQTPLNDVPRTLAHVPGGDGPGDVHAEFDDILKLDGYALEDALARMTPAQRERFARA